MKAIIISIVFFALLVALFGGTAFFTNSAWADLRNYRRDWKSASCTVTSATVFNFSGEPEKKCSAESFSFKILVDVTLDGQTAKSKSGIFDDPPVYCYLNNTENRKRIDEYNDGDKEDCWYNKEAEDDKDFVLFVDRTKTSRYSDKRRQALWLTFVAILLFIVALYFLYVIYKRFSAPKVITDIRAETGPDSGIPPPPRRPMTQGDPNMI